MISTEQWRACVGLCSISPQPGADPAQNLTGFKGVPKKV